MRYRDQYRRAKGFTLVEVMVGMVIALIGMVMMFQAMSVWDARKRTTSSGTDAQITGSIAMFSLERDLGMGGYGFANSNAMGCAVSAYDSTRTAPGLFNFVMAPVLITDGVSGAPDTLTVLYGSGGMMSMTQSFSSLVAGSMALNTRIGMRAGDLLIAADAGNTVCGLFEVTANNNPDAISVTFDTTAYTNYTNNQNVTAQTSLAAGPLALLQVKFLNNSGTARFNNGTTLGVGTSGGAFNMGTGPVRNVWQITNRRFLTVSNSLANQATATEVAEGIVDLQAQYGIDTNNDGVIAANEWTSTTPLTSATWTQLRAVRVALLARSQQFERTAVTVNSPAWDGGSFVMTDLGGGTPAGDDTPNDWRHYRYRVYSKTIPLRNMLWGID
jgi:type IV pilus assembly protein PilW